MTVDDDLRGLGPVALVREGAALHFARGAAVTTDDPDLALLAGDRAYALGLEQLAAAADLDAIDALCVVISATARAHAAGRPDDAETAWTQAEPRLRHVPHAQAPSSPTRLT